MKRFAFAAMIVVLSAFAFTPGFVRADIAESPAIGAADVPQCVSDSISASGRPAADKELDAGRRPDQMMAFFGIKPGMKVADIFAGGGYTTELLSRIVGPTGTVYSQNGPLGEKFKKIGDAWHARLKNPELKNVVEVDKPFDAKDLIPVAPGTLDAVVMNMNYHDMVGFHLGPDHVNAAVFEALKPGGIYGVVDHSAAKGSGDRDAATLHRIDQDFETKQIEAAGFKLAAASSAMRHPEDDRTWFVFAHRGATDRFMLKFVKPEK
jgi:predicted methyltransferase